MINLLSSLDVIQAQQRSMAILLCSVLQREKDKIFFCFGRDDSCCSTAVCLRHNICRKTTINNTYLWIIMIVATILLRGSQYFSCCFAFWSHLTAAATIARLVVVKQDIKTKQVCHKDFKLSSQKDYQGEVLEITWKSDM